MSEDHHSDQEKQSLTRSLEGEIEILRGEVERHLHENSALKLELPMVQM